MPLTPTRKIYYIQFDNEPIDKWTAIELPVDIRSTFRQRDWVHLCAVIETKLLSGGYVPAWDRKIKLIDPKTVRTFSMPIVEHTDENN